ncbi:MAG: ATP-binding domain-containing protein [Gammaproteobacteria bacterium]|nr:ATP-binding domain-containing protein [Gammaproteobacteria bacterium]
MAKIYPSDLPRLDTSEIKSAELDTLRKLQAELPAEYSVFHSVHWSRADEKNTAYGEIDFIIMNNTGKVLVIEQKNGMLEETPNGLVKSYGLTKKVVGDQIQRNIGNIREKFSKQHPGGEKLYIDYLIYCPDYKVININAAGIDRERVVDGNSKAGLSGYIKRLLDVKSDASPESVRELHEFFLSSLRIVPDVASYKSSQERVYRQLLSGLSDVIDNLEFEPFRLRVTGTAGSGKTQVTLAFFDRMLAQGKKPLLLCFNRPLADRLREIAGNGVTVNTYYGFCREMAELAGVPVDFSNINKDGFWPDVQERLVAADLTDTPRYSCLIVDEGQDFLAEWHEIIKLFLTEDAVQLWLEDPLQNLRGTDAVPLPGFVTYNETSNFRTPTSIAGFIKQSLGQEFRQRNMLPGLGVQMFEYSRKNQLEGKLAHRVNELVKAGFKLGDIAIISCRGMDSTALRETDRLGHHYVRRFTGKYDEHDNQIYTEGELLFDTIFRYKGQQAPVIILTDLDESLEVSERARKILYCAMTRATVLLELIVEETCPWLEAFRKSV